MKEPATSSDIDITPTLRRPAPELGPRARRTIDLILDATKSVFLARGYGDTSIDDITRVARISRASFYTYFPSKLHALLALGADAGRLADVLIDELGDASGVDDIAAWVERYFEFLDDYGSFVLAWTQAAHAQDELRARGVKRHLASCRRLGLVLERLRGSPLGDPTQQGLLVLSMLERAWSHCRLYKDAVDERAMWENAALVIAATVSTETDGRWAASPSALGR